MFCTGVLRATRTLAAHCTLKSAARMTRSILGQNVRIHGGLFLFPPTSQGMACLWANDASVCVAHGLAANEESVCGAPAKPSSRLHWTVLMYPPLRRQSFRSTTVIAFQYIFKRNCFRRFPRERRLSCRLRPTLLQFLGDSIHHVRYDFSTDGSWIYTSAFDDHLRIHCL